MLFRSSTFYSSPGEPRIFLVSEWRRLSFKRRVFEPFVGFVGRRFFGGIAISFSQPANCSRQPMRLSNWLRDFSQEIKMLPSVSNFEANRTTKRCRTSSGKLGDASGRQRSVAFEFTLLTFCPPGPELRANWKSNSSCGICIRSVTTNRSFGGDSLDADELGTEDAEREAGRSFRASFFIPRSSFFIPRSPNNRLPRNPIGATQ